MYINMYVVAGGMTIRQPQRETVGTLARVPLQKFSKHSRILFYISYIYSWYVIRSLSQTDIYPPVSFDCLDFRLLNVDESSQT